MVLSLLIANRNNIYGHLLTGQGKPMVIQKKGALVVVALQVHHLLAVIISVTQLLEVALFQTVGGTQMTPSGMVLAVVALALAAS